MNIIVCLDDNQGMLFNKRRQSKDRQVLEDIDIADIYINNSYIDVRLYFNDEELGVPKAHFDNNLLPVAYMFIKVSPDL